MLAVVLEGLVEETDENERLGGATGRKLGELLQNEDVSFVRATGGELEEFSELVNEDERAQVADLGRGGIHVGERGYDGGAVEEGFALSAAEKLAQFFCERVKLTFLCDRNGVEDALEQA